MACFQTVCAIAHAAAHSVRAEGTASWLQAAGRLSLLGASAPSMGLPLDSSPLQIEPFSTLEARIVVEQELGAPIDELFSEFSAEPIAAASLAQVGCAWAACTWPQALPQRAPGRGLAGVKMLLSFPRLYA